MLERNPLLHLPANAAQLGRRDFLTAIGTGFAAGSCFGASRVKITRVEVIALEDRMYGTTLVRVHTDAGIDGIGQASAPALMIDAIIHARAGLERRILGEDPLQVERLWQKMYGSTAVWGRRGLVMGAIGAIETALWDVAGKILERPMYELVWRAFAGGRASSPGARDKVEPYATVWPPGNTEAELRRTFGIAVERGFRGVKFEQVRGGFANGDVRRDVEVVKLVRSIIGQERKLMLDAQYNWEDVGQALASLNAVKEYGIYFIEAPLPADNYEGYRRLSEKTDIRIAAGDRGFTTRFEFSDLMDRAGVSVVQPSTVHSGGVGEIMKIAEDAYRKGLLCVPHSWDAIVGIAAGVHIAAVAPNVPCIEFPVEFPATPLISELLVPQLKPDSDGLIAVPARPGLGFSLNADVLKRFQVSPA